VRSGHGGQVGRIEAGVVPRAPTGGDVRLRDQVRVFLYRAPVCGLADVQALDGEGDLLAALPQPVDGRVQEWIALAGGVPVIEDLVGACPGDDQHAPASGEGVQPLIKRIEPPLHGDQGPRLAAEKVEDLVPNPSHSLAEAAGTGGSNHAAAGARARAAIAVLRLRCDSG
jgi:hypothetical protein